MFGVEELSVKLRQRRLRCFGHVKRAGGVLGELVEVRVWGQQLSGRPRKKWNECVMEDMNLLGVDQRSMPCRIDRCGKQLSPI